MKSARVLLAALVLVAPLAAATSRAIDISGFAFDPTPLAAQAGDLVTWTNRDSATHTVTCDAGSCGFASTNLAGGASFATTLSGAGTQSYHCSIHTSMHGKLFVGSGALADADLAPDAGTLAGARPLVGGLVPDPRAAHVSVLVRNVGGAASAHGTNVEFRAEDATGADMLLGTALAPALAAGASATVYIDWQGAPLVGDQDVRVVVDPANGIVEGVETNNEARGAVHVGLV